MTAAGATRRRLGTSRGIRPALWRQHSVRQLFCFVVTGLLVAVMSGPQGNASDPTYGLRHSIGSLRAVWFALGAVAVWGVAQLWKQYAGGWSWRRVTAGFSGPATGDRRARLAYPAIVVVVAVAAPPLLSAYWQQVLVDQVGIFALLALGLNVVVGFAGLLDLGYVAFYAIGAYTTAYFTGKLPVLPPVSLNPFFIIPIAVAAAMLAGVLLGAPVLRLRGDYLAIVTLGFGEIVRLVAVNSDPITNGSRGAFGIPHFSVHVGGLNYDWGLTNLPYYYLLLFIIAVIVVAYRRLEESRVGRAWTAIREDEVAAAASGIPTVRYKLLAFAIGASTSGFAGVLFASKISFISPDAFTLQFSILVLVLVIFGGMGSIPGVILGALVLQVLPEALRDYVPEEDRFIYFGALLVVMMIFRPQGLLPARRRARELALAETGEITGDAMALPKERAAEPGTAS